MRSRNFEYLLIAVFISVFFVTIFSRSLVLLSVLAAVLGSLIAGRGKISFLYPLAIFSISSGAIALVINLYFRNPELVTVKMLINGAALAALRIFALAEISIAYGSTVSGEVSYDFFSKFLPRSAILTAISILLLPRLANSLAQTRESLIQRGILAPGKPRLKDLKNFTFLFKAAVIEAVEESWSITETLIQRGYSVRQQ